MGSESMIGDVMRIQRTPSWCQPKFIILGDGVDTLANDRVKLYNFKFVAYTDIYRVWSGRCHLFPKSEPDLTVDLNNCVLDASSRCGLSLAARVTVEPAGHSGACHLEPEQHRAELELHGLIFHVFFSSSLSSPQDKMHCQLSLTVGLCTPCQKSKLQQYNRFFFVGSCPLHSCL